MFTEGLDRVFIELIAVNKSANKGKACLPKIQLESIAFWVVRWKLSPPWQDEIKTGSLDRTVANLI
jgi:hypothetical protein